jgi:hypothetical protein
VDPLRVDLRGLTAAADPLFQPLVRSASFSFSLPRSAHSQTISTRQPCATSVAISRLSRATFLPILSSQKSVRVAGTLNR